MQAPPLAQGPGPGPCSFGELYKRMLRICRCRSATSDSYSSLLSDIRAGVWALHDVDLLAMCHWTPLHLTEGVQWSTR
jgi:hypothetical protein